MDGLNNAITRITDLMEKNNRGVQLGCYSVALVGLTIAIRRVRPFSRFKKPSDIPNHFIQERRQLTGVVERIDPNGAMLMIKHKPLVAIPGIPEGQLPVKISGIDVSGLGISWLQTIVAGSEVKFVPVMKERNCVQCEVLLPQTTINVNIPKVKKKKKKEQTVNVNVGESLVRIGFGHVVEADKPISKEYLTYLNRLQVAQNYALRKKLGLKYYVEPTKNGLVAVAKNLSKLIRATSKQIARVPKLAAS